MTRGGCSRERPAWNGQRVRFLWSKTKLGYSLAHARSRRWAYLKDRYPFVVQHERAAFLEIMIIELILAESSVAGRCPQSDGRCAKQPQPRSDNDDGCEFGSHGSVPFSRFHILIF